MMMKEKYEENDEKCNETNTCSQTQRRHQLQLSEVFSSSKLVVMVMVIGHYLLLAIYLKCSLQLRPSEKSSQISAFSIRVLVRVHPRIAFHFFHVLEVAQ